MKLLFLLKKNYRYFSPYSQTKAAGLFNSATFVVEALEKHLLIDTSLEICVDGNEIDKYVTKYRPDICILEAIWVTPEKLRELVKIHKHVHFIIRIHSNIPFLANEGVAIGWIKQSKDIHNVSIAFNNNNTTRDFELIGINNLYLPNIYVSDGHYHHHRSEEGIAIRMLKYKLANMFSISYFDFPGEVINIACMGAIRPQKNQLIQAFAAISYADKAGIQLNFHINSTRVEQKGDSILKNLRSLFSNSCHKLIEHDWMSHKEFLSLIRTMDLGMQVSESESFNIVTADFVSQDIPIVVSHEISWMPEITKVGTSSSHEIMHKIDKALKFKELYTDVAYEKLLDYNCNSLETWANFLKKTLIC